MSRSALARSQQRNQGAAEQTSTAQRHQQLLQQQQMLMYSQMGMNYATSYQYPSNFTINQQYPSVPPQYSQHYPQATPQYSQIPTQYVPIKLTGDEDDNDDPNNRKSTIPMQGNPTTYNINNLLHQNIMENEYFRALYQLKTYHEVLDEIRICAKHVEPWATGTSRTPSSAFCLLLKLLVMKMTYKQMNGILNCEDNAFVRCIGFLYLRYTLPPSDLYKWFEPYLEDGMLMNPCSDQEIEMTVGAFCIKLLTDMQYFGTTLPRIPFPI